MSWNASALLRECLTSLKRQSLPRDQFQVVVVDNASIDDTPAMLAMEFPDVQCVRTDRNAGFAGGANLALRELTTPFVVLLNNDATADPGFLQNLTEALAGPGAEHVAAVTARVRLAGSGLLNSTGNEMSRRGRGSDRDWLLPDDGRRQAGEVFGFCGAAVALRREALEEVGLFDESLFLYYEDSDLSWRLRAAGWTIRYEPSALAIHGHATSSGVGSARFTLWNERNSLIVFTRHAPAPLVVAMHARRLVGLVVHTAHTPLTAVTRARWRAFGQHFARLPRTMRERRQTWRDAAVSRAEVSDLLVR